MERIDFKDLPDTTTPITAENLNSLSNSIVVKETGTDLNNYHEAGVYYFGQNYTPSNAPNDVVNGWLHVMDSGDYSVIKQVWYRHGTNNTNDYETYVRTYNATSATWSNWHELFVNDNVKDWTPSLANANVTYTMQTGKYMKIGNLVFVWFRLRGTINSVSEPRHALINGLPYNCSYETSGNILEHLNITNDNTRNVILRVVGNQLGIQGDNEYAGAGVDRWYASENTFYLGGSAVYITNE